MQLQGTHKWPREIYIIGSIKLTHLDVSRHSKVQCLNVELLQDGLHVVVVLWDILYHTDQDEPLH